MIGKSQIRDHYNDLAATYSRRYEGLSERYYNAMEDRCIYQLVDFSHKTVLDMGTGSGRFAFSILREGKAGKVIGIDIAERFVDIARSSALENENISFCVMDGENTAFCDSVFDVVIIPGLFEYVHDLQTYLRECSRILKPGGELVFTCWNTNKWFAWMIFNDRMNGSVEHSLKALETSLRNEKLSLVSWNSTFFIPTRVFFGILRRLAGHGRLQNMYVNTIISFEHMLRNSLFRARGGELIVKAVKTA